MPQRPVSSYSGWCQAPAAAVELKRPASSPSGRRQAPVAGVELKRPVLSPRSRRQAPMVGVNQAIEASVKPQWPASCPSGRRHRGWPALRPSVCLWQCPFAAVLSCRGVACPGRRSSLWSEAAAVPAMAGRDHVCVGSQGGQGLTTASKISGGHISPCSFARARVIHVCWCGQALLPAEMPSWLWPAS